jgi:urease accessory protein
VFACRGGRTILAHAYAEPPFRAPRGFEGGGGLHLILPWSSPGIFGGDRLTQHVRVERGARVRLTSQSAMQAHASADGRHAQLVSTYVVAEGAELSCEWDPTIPFAAARLVQRTAIRLAASARLAWSDGFMCGRVRSGERWAFSELSHELKVLRERSLEYLERFHLVPQDGGADRTWVADGSSYFGTVLWSGHSVAPELIDDLHRQLAGIACVRAAVDRLDRRLMLARLMATAGAPFREARAVVGKRLEKDAGCTTYVEWLDRQRAPFP